MSHRVVKYRLVGFNQTQAERRHWFYAPVADFQKVFNGISDNVYIVHAVLYESRDERNGVRATYYDVIAKWDWFRTDNCAALNDDFRKLAAREPDRYKKTREGVWVRHPSA